MPKLTPSVLEVAGGGSRKSNKLKGARWIKANEVVEIQDLEITGGLFYLGQSLPRVDGASNENCLVDPSLAVSQTRADTFGHDMPYWPSYSTITPWSRKAYLDWLRGTRADATSYVGYAFLNFYGLERRLLLDHACDDADAILAEVTRLLKVYASNRSFQHYGGALLLGYERNAFVSHRSRSVAAQRNPTEARGRNSSGGGHYRRRPSSADAVYVAASGTFELQLARAALDARQQDLFDDRKHAIVRGYAGDDHPVTIIRASQSDLSAVHVIAPVPPFNTPIDLNKLSDIRRETGDSASLLDAIFSDECDASPSQRHQTPIRTREDADVLDDRHRAFLCKLLTQLEWARPDFDDLAKQFGLMPYAAREKINEWTCDRFDKLIISGEDPVHVERFVVPDCEIGVAA